MYQFRDDATEHKQSVPSGLSQIAEASGFNGDALFGSKIYI